MSSEMLSIVETIGILFSILLGITSIVFGAIQLRNQNRQLKAATSTLFSSRLHELNQALLEYAEIDFELQGNNQLRPLADLPPLQRTRLQLQLIMRYNLYEELFVQHKKYQTMDSSDWLAWRRTIKQEFGRSRVREYWHQVKSLYDLDFVEAVDNIIAELGSQVGSIYDLSYAQRNE